MPELPEVLDELEAAIIDYADKEQERIRRKANLLRRLYLPSDDFSSTLEREELRITLNSIRGLTGV